MRPHEVPKGGDPLGREGPPPSDENQAATKQLDKQSVASAAGIQGGMSSRAIATVLGVSHTTVLRDAKDFPPHFTAGLDGKLYRSRSHDERRYLVAQCHDESHTNNLSIRQIVAVFATEDLRISVGTVAGYLKNWRCEHCPGGLNPPPAHPDHTQPSVQGVQTAPPEHHSTTKPDELPTEYPWEVPPCPKPN
jgi:hypothetical protein